MLFHRQEHNGHAVIAGLWEADPKFAAFPCEEDVGYLNQNARTITRLRVATRGPAMSQVNKHFETLANDLVALLSTDARHHAHTAGIMFISWVIEALSGWRVTTKLRCMHGDLPNELSRCEMHCVAGIHTHGAISPDGNRKNY